jgi:simple sugar transport system ATP-binding protein
VAVLIVSSELDEIYALADRIAVMYEGKITGFRDPGVTATELGRLMAGGADVAGPVPDAAIEPGALPGSDPVGGYAAGPGPPPAAPPPASPGPPPTPPEEP